MMKINYLLLLTLIMPWAVRANTPEPTSALAFQQTTNTRIVVEENHLRFFTGGNERMTIDENGNVGVGTSSPSHKLEVIGDSNTICIKNDTKDMSEADLSNYIKGVDKNDNLLWYLGDGSGAKRILVAARGDGSYPLDFEVNMDNRMRIDVNGNVGINTTSPIDKLTLNGGDMTIGNTTDHEYNIWFRPSDNNPRSSVIGYSSGNVYNDYIGMKTQWGSIRFITNSGNEVVRITNNQRVGIGTTTPSYKLHVNGDARANRFISNTNTYVDFVFEDDYRLAPLSEVEAYIEENNHLPDIPSEAEARKNGVDLQDMQAKLLQKIEELTLYVIDLKKENESQQKEIEELKSKKVNQKIAK